MKVAHAVFFEIYIHYYCNIDLVVKTNKVYVDPRQNPTQQ